MLKREDSGGATWARACDTCRSASATVYCRPDSAYLCNGCDARIHAANKVASRHERVWVCEACERAPAAFLCKADAASLCTTCDSDIHSANPLAHRHHRVPVLPLPAALYGNHVTDPVETMIGVNNSAGDVDDRGFLAQDVDETVDDHTDEDEAASWLLPNPVKNNGQGNNNNNGMLFGAGGEDVDGYLDLVEYNSCHDNHYSTGGAHDFVYHSQQQQFSVPQKSYGGDSVVPIRPDAVGKDQLHLQQQHQIYQFGLEYEASNATGYGYSASMSHSMSMSSMDCGIVPESTSSDVSVPHRRAPKGTIGPFSSAPVQMPQQLPPMDREARVLRYREKKKTRKFEKTIRYASRKAYAETRPRIKGRFAKRTDAEVDVEVDQMFSTALMMDSGGYGIVPSF